MPPRGDDETLAIPERMRAEVDARDLGYCRFCGRYAGPQRALHHIEYGGMGQRRRHAVDNLMTVGWLFDHDCHTVIHSNKRLWMPLCLEVVKRPGVTVLQLYRWTQRESSGLTVPRQTPP